MAVIIATPDPIQPLPEVVQVAQKAVEVKPLPEIPNIAPLPHDLNAPVLDGSLLWMRKWHLSVGTQKGDEAVDLSPLAFEFDIQQQQGTPTWRARITVYNVGEDLLQQMQKEFTFVSLSVGYQPPSTQYGLLFKGPIGYFKYGRLDATTTFAEIHSLSQDIPVNYTTINTWLKTGYTKKDVVKACIDAMNQGHDPVKEGQLTILGDEKSPRGRVLFGMARDILKDVAYTANAKVFIDTDNKLHMLREDEALNATDTVPVLTPGTGLIGSPTVTLGAGVEIRSLLNPNLTPGKQLKVDTKYITQFQAVDPTAAVMTNFDLRNSAKSMSGDGYYVVGAVRHWGHNRGDPWYSDVSTKPFNVSKMPPQGPPTTM
jgi:hypothetical protein